MKINKAKKRMEGIEEISQEQVDEIIMSNENGKGEYKPLGKFYSKEQNAYVAIDNSKGDAFVEEFTDKKSCISWLNNEFEIGERKNRKHENRQLKRIFI